MLLTDDKYLDKDFSKPNRRVLVIEENKKNHLAVVKLNSLAGKSKKIKSGRLLPLGINQGTAFGAEVYLYTEQSNGFPIKPGKYFKLLPWHLRKNKRKTLIKHLYSNKKRPDISKTNRSKRKDFYK